MPLGIAWHTMLLEFAETSPSALGILLSEGKPEFEEMPTKYNINIESAFARNKKPKVSSVLVSLSTDTKNFQGPYVLLKRDPE